MYEIKSFISSQWKSSHTNIMLLRHYIVAAVHVTSTLVFNCFERQRAQRFIKQVYKCNQWLKIYQKRWQVSQRFKCKQEIKRCDVTYTNSVVGLASQEVDVLANLTNEKLWNLYGYDEMTRPHLSIQTQVKKSARRHLIRVSPK